MITSWEVAKKIIALSCYAYAHACIPYNQEQTSTEI